MAVCWVPVLDPIRALHSTGEHIDPFTLVHWVLHDSIRATRTSMVLPLRDLNYGSLPPAVFRVVGSLEEDNDRITWATPQPYFLEHLIEDQLFSGAELLTAEQVAESGHALTSLAGRRPGAIVRDLLANAKAAKRDGDSRSALVNFAIACEVALDQLLFALLWEEGATPADASALFSDNMAIVNRVRTFYHERLGGKWSTNQQGPIHDWEEDVARPRNRVLHRGTIPTSHEVATAENATHTLTAFMAQRLVLSFDSYPRSMAIITGENSINRYASRRRRPEILRFLDEERQAAEIEFVEWLDEWQ